MPCASVAAVAARRSAPTLTPSGAKTVLHDSAKACTKVPPHGSSCALWTTRAPLSGSGLISVRTGNLSVSFTSWPSSAAVVVITLKIEPGGCGEEYADPASASTLPLRVLRTTAPPDWPPSALTVVDCGRGSIVVLTG